MSVAFYFPVGTVDKLDELVKNRDDFKICEYSLVDFNQYDLDKRGCRDTSFKVKFEFNNAKFCSHHLYDAIFQYGHYQNKDEFSWHLWVRIVR